jgi:hypothetical protein
MLFVGSAAASRPLVFVCFPLFFGRSPFLGFITAFTTGLSVLSTSPCPAPAPARCASWFPAAGGGGGGGPWMNKPAFIGFYYL